MSASGITLSCLTLLLLLLQLLQPVSGLRLVNEPNVKTLEGSSSSGSSSSAGSGRFKRAASSSSSRFVPLEFFGDSNGAAQATYPLSSASSPVDEESKYRYIGVPDSPQSARLRGDLPNMNPNEGRVELQYKMNWGLACDDYFGKEEADVYCKTLGFKKGANKPVINSFFGTGRYRRWDILIGNVKCKDFKREQSLFQCYYNIMPSCSLRSTAGVQCTYNEGCEHGWSAYDGICYRVEEDPQTPEAAAEACARKGSILAAITSSGESDFISNMLFTKFKNISALWTGGRYAKFKDLQAYEAWAFKDTIHKSSSSNMWFPGFSGSSDARPIGDPKTRSCIAMSKIFNKQSTGKDVDVNYFWWDNISCKNRLPYLCQKLGKLTKDCYSGDGSDYRGEAQRTNQGTPCQQWNESTIINANTHPDSGLGSHRFCRNPDGDEQPWCWVDARNAIFGYCSLRRCDNDADASAAKPPPGKAEFNNSKCDRPDQFFCPSMINYRPICVEKSQVCNGHTDCVGGEDEAADFCKKYKCQDNQFYCKKSHRCISFSRVCNKYFDCDYGDDESVEVCKNFTKNANDTEILQDYTKVEGVNETAIPSGVQLTVYYHVSLSQCKSQCDSSMQFVCKAFMHYAHFKQYNTTKCILLAAQLSKDQLATVKNGQASYYQRNASCSEPNFFLCNNSRCIERSKICNGYDECGDFSDEIGPKQCPSPKPTFSVRLRGGKSPHEGRVEVKLFNEWGLVCDDGLDANLATVVCKQINFTGYERYSKNSRKEFGRGSGQFLLSSVNCTGNEQSLYDCRHSAWHQAGSCSVGNVAGIVCLKPRPCTDKEFKCMDRCIPLSEVCDGKQQCSSGEDEEQCGKDDLKLQLVNGHNSSSGVVEIIRGGIAGAVCDDTFGDNEAKVVCAQLKIPGRVKTVKGGQFKAPAGLVMWLQTVQCAGTEQSLFDCQLRNWGRTLCDIKEAVGVVCGLPELPATTAAPTAAQVTSAATTAAGSNSNNNDCGNRIGNFPAGRIINGYPATVGQFPWQVGIRLKLSETETQQWCGGTVISDRWLVTAAHCFDYTKSYYQLRIGDIDNTKMDTYERHFDIDLLILHPQYSGKPAFDYDITLIRIKPDSKGYLTFNTGIQPACLPDPDLVVPPNTVCHISGWGSVGDFQIPENLMAANVPLITRDRCNQLYSNRITERMQCAGFEAGGIDSCQGDSGGPLVCKVQGKYTIIGATSWGEGCAVPGSPGVYANVRNLRQWIDETISRNS